MAYTTIDKGSLYFNTVLYTGNGSTQSITGVGFQPDFTWIKARNDTHAHNLFDVVRGVHKGLQSNSTNAEYDISTTLTSFDTDGFSIGSAGGVNQSPDTYASWNWLAGGTASSNTDGSITSSVSANTTSGFSIVSYTGTGSAATIGHSLGVAPSMIIVKNRSATADWKVYHKSLGATKWLKLSTADAAGTSSGNWNDTEPTSSVFSVGTDAGTNGSGNSEIAYCFAEKKGFSKFSSYEGNNSTDGTFVYTGFSPAFILTKNIDSADHWTLWDNKRENNINPNNNVLYPSTSGAESTSDATYYCDMLSNGFKWRGTSTGMNGAYTYIYAAFSESPLTTSTGIPTTAR